MCSFKICIIFVLKSVLSDVSIVASVLFGFSTCMKYQGSLFSFLRLRSM